MIERVKVHPLVALAALRRREGREARLWHLARELDAMGSGWWDVADLQGALDELDADGLSPSTVRRLLQAGDGTWWDVIGEGPDRHVRLYGLEAVAAALEVDHVGHPVWAPLEHVRRVKTWRGAVRGAFCASRAGCETWTSPISRAKLEELTGYDARTIRGWERELGGAFRSRPNAWLRSEDVPHLPMSRSELEDLNEQGFFLEKIGERVVLLAFLPSSYWCAYKLAPRGQCRKVNRALRPSSYAGATQHTRLFYADPKALARRTHGLGEGERAFGYTTHVDDRDVRRSRGGWHLWTRHTKLEGGLCYR